MFGQHIESDCAPAVPRRAGQVLLLLLVGSVGINLALLNPIHNYLLDFRGYYAAGLAVRAGVNPYSPSAVREHVTLPGPQSIVPYLYSPPTLGLMYVVSLLPYPAGQVPWCLFQYALLLAALWLVLRTLNCPLGSPTSVLIAFAFLTSSAVRELFRWGQFDLLPLALLAAAVLALQRGRSAIAGFAVGLAAVAKVTPVLGLATLLLRRERKALVAGVATITVLLAGSCAVLGIQIIPAWLLRLSAFGDDLGTHVTPHNVSLPGFVYRALVTYPGPPDPSVPWFDLGPSAARVCVLLLSAGVIAVTAWWIHRTRHVVSSGECLAATIPVALLISPVTWTHYGVQLLIPLALIIATVLRQPRLRPLDACWLLLMLMFYTNWPVEHLALTLPSQLAHLVGPTMTYATGLIWLFMLIRYAPLKQTAGEQWTLSPSAASEPALAHG
jgi:hypothetical protein